MKIRITKYSTAKMVFSFLKFFWWDIFGRGVVFDEMVGEDYLKEFKEIYYLIELR